MNNVICLPFYHNNDYVVHNMFHITLDIIKKKMQIQQTESLHDKIMTIEMKMYQKVQILANFNFPSMGMATCLGQKYSLKVKAVYKTKKKYC